MNKNGSFLTAILVITLLVTAILIYQFRLTGTTPEVILPTTTPPPASHGGEGGGNLTESIEINAGNAKIIVETLRRTDSYYQSMIITKFWDGGSGIFESSVWADGDNYFLTVKSGDEIKNTLILGGDLWIWYEDKSSYYKGTLEDMSGNLPDSFQMILTYEDFLDIPDEDISDAAYREFGGEACIFVEYTSGEMGYKNRLYISASSGLLYALETYDGDTLIFTALTNDLQLSAPPDNIFTPPAQS